MEHLPVLRQVGWVLVVVGLLDVAYMVYCIINGLSYSSSLNFFAVVAGVFLLRGSLRAASVVRWLAVFMLSAVVPALLSLPLLQPRDLTLTQMRLHPGQLVAGALLTAGLLALLTWLGLRLGHPAVLAARQAAGKKLRDMRIPVALGLGVAALLGATVIPMLSGERAARAKALAREQLGEVYSYHVTSMNIGTNEQQTTVSATVTAWNNNDIRTVSVRWQERGYG